MSSRKDQARNHGRERDVGRARNRPPARETRWTERCREGHVDQCRRDHASNSGGEWRERTTRRRQRTARQCRFEDLLRGECEEEHHANVVHPEVQWVGDCVVRD